MAAAGTPDAHRSWSGGRPIVSPSGTGVLAADFGDAGLWCAALSNPALDVLVERRIGIIDPPRLDRRLGEYLIADGRIPAETAAAVPGEVAEVTREARHQLADRDGVFLMGTEHIRLLRVSRDDLAVALEDEFSELVATLSELRSEAGTGSEVLWGPGFAAWPGLPEQLAALGWQQQVTPLGVPRRRRRADDAPLFGGIGFTPLGGTAQIPAVAAMAAADERPTDVLPRIEDSWPEESWPEAGVEVTDVLAPSAGPARRSEASEPPATPGRHRSRRRLRLGHRARAAAVGVGLVAVLAGGATAVAVTDPQDGDATPTTSEPATSTVVEDEFGPKYADPDEVDAARAPVVRYTSPTPEPTTPSSTPTTSAPAQPNSPRRNRPAPPPLPIPIPEPGQTIPNPIPGLPPIVIPG